MGGAAAGGLLGGLAGLGFWKAEADVPTEALERGDVVIGVQVADERMDAARRCLSEASRRSGGD